MVTGPSKGTPDTRTAEPPAERLRAELRRRDRIPRTEIEGLLDLDPRSTAKVLASSEDIEVGDDGIVRLVVTPEGTGQRQDRRPKAANLLEAAERGAQIVAEDPLVVACRKRYGLIEFDQLPEWIEARSESGEPVRFETLDQDGALVMQSTPFIAYAWQGIEAACYVASTRELEPLRKASEHIARTYGWQPAYATIFVLTGKWFIGGQGLGLHVKRTTRIGPADLSEHVQVSGSLECDSQGFAQTVSDARRKAGVQKSLPDRDAERFAALRRHVEALPAGVKPQNAESFRIWKENLPDDAPSEWRYKDERRQFRTAVNRMRARAARHRL